MAQTSFPVQQLANHPATVSANASSQAHTRREHSRISQLDWVLFGLFILGTGALLLRGWQFYTLTVTERVDHPDFRVLGPSTHLGRAYGIAGTCMILTNLLYLVRRRFARLSVGSLRAWLDIHTFTGLFGGMLVIFHSAFQVRSTIAAITVGSLFVAILTGIIGRSLHCLSPKPDMLRLRRQLLVLDRVGPGMGQMLSHRLGQVERASAPDRSSLWLALWALPSYLREMRQRRAVVDRTVAEYAQYYGREVQLLRRQIADCRDIWCSEVRAAGAAVLLRSWRSVHRLSALLMVLLVVLHIAIAWYYGFVWATTH